MFGEDDFTLWPQLYHPETPHLACIPTYDPDPSSPIHIFRRGLTREWVEFRHLEEYIVPVGTISPRLIDQIKAVIDVLVARANKSLRVSSRNHSRLRKLLELFCRAVRKLTECVDTLHELRVVFGVAARACLETHGYLDYHTIYLPRLGSSELPAVDDDVVGVLVRDEADCERFFRMGIPVWYVRDSTTPGLPVHGPGFVQPTHYRDRPRHPGCLRDDGYFRGLGPMLVECLDAGDLSVVFDGWMKMVLG
jgi:hypothetical protein